MKNLYLYLTLIILSNSCKENNVPQEEVNKPETYCILKQVNVKANIEDKNGVIKQTTNNSNYYTVKDTVITTSNSVNTYQYTYDKDGYLIRQYSKIQYSSSNLVSTFSEINYAYINLKLIDRQTVNGNLQSAITVGSTDKFEYDEVGKIKKYTQISNNGSQIIRGFINGIQKSYIIKNADGTESNITNLFDENGYRVKEQLTSKIEQRNFYDTNGNLIKREFWESGVLGAYAQLEYSPIKNKQTLAIPLPKGHPFISSTSGSGNNLMIKSKTYNFSGVLAKLYLSGESTITYKLNNDGLITEQTNIVNNYDEKEVFNGKQISTSNFIYSGCK